MSKTMGAQQNNADTQELDIFRNTALRYLGYANEVGESFRSMIPVSAVRFSYVIASGYVCADAFSKGRQASQVPWPDRTHLRRNVFQAVADTFIWQGLASVVIPGFTINRICYLSGRILHRNMSSLPLQARKWTVTFIGLVSIPVIIKPIDHAVDTLMENTFRKWFGVGSVLEEAIVHHIRND